jgi:fumarylacetoacetase
MSPTQVAPLRSWIEVSEDHDFPIQNLPFGIFRTRDRSARPGVAIGDAIVDLSALFQAGLLNVRGLMASALTQPYLNDLIALGKPVTRGIRERLTELLREDNPELRDNPSLRERCLVRRLTSEMQMPVLVGDYTDFYSSIDHATNVGAMFRDPDNALLPNWKHLPVGYHGRSSSIVVSGTPIHRPKGQQMPDGADAPVFGPTRLLDFELEMAFVAGKATALGESIPTAQAEDHIFGLMLFNDLSARDIQTWEYVLPQQLPLPLLEHGPAARPPDRQRMQYPGGRSLRFRHHFRPGSRQLRLHAGADLEGQQTHQPARIRPAQIHRRR